jgi:Putative Ig domain
LLIYEARKHMKLKLNEGAGPNTMAPRRPRHFRLAALLSLALFAGLTATSVPAATAATTPTVPPSCATNPAPKQITCFAVANTAVKAHAATPGLPPAGYGPSSLQAAYSLPSATAGSGQTVALIDAFDTPTAEADLAVYRAQYGLPACTTANGCFRKVNNVGQPSPLPGPPPVLDDWTAETSLDLDMVSAACPNCHILLVEANSDDDGTLYSAINTAVTLGAKFVSMSWGSDEGYGTPDVFFSSHPGVVFTASTGDNDYAGGIIFPAISPDVVAVGGTTLTPANNARGWNETAWNNLNGHGTGSGCSVGEPAPAYQVGITGCANRAAADVSADADPNTGVAVYNSYRGGGWNVYGGTSASSPFIAATYALAGTRSANDNGTATPYGNKTQLNDVTTGNNGSCGGALVCTAAIGWDGPTGLGTPNGIGAFRAGVVNTLTLANPGAQSSVAGTAVSLPLKATDSSSTAPLTYSASGLPTGLSINSSTGLISGTPSVVGQTSSVGVSVTDTSGATAAQRFTWAVTLTAPHVVSVTNPGAQSTMVGASVSLPVMATDSVASTLTYTVSGLPTGLSINAATGLISGTPIAATTRSVTVTATDPTGAFGSATFAWTVIAGPTHVVTVARPSVPSTVVGTAVNLQVQATDTPPATLTYKASSLPSGLAINASTGLISGTATTPSSSTVTITATDPTGAAGSTVFTWTVTAAKHVVTMTNPGTQSTVLNTATSLQIHATDSVTSTLTYVAAGLPNGLTINASTGLISGTPTAVGSYTPAISVSDPTGATAAVSFTWTITAATPPARTVTVINPGNQSSVRGSQAGLQLKATDSVASTLTYQAAGLPTGLTINSSTGLILGTPTTTGSYSVTVTATDPAGTKGTASFNWTITSGSATTTVTFTNPGNQSTAKGSAVTLPLNVSSNAAFQIFKFGAVGLPTGLSINASTGVISGTPTTTGTFTVTVTAIDYAGTPAGVTFTWTVR